MSRSLLILTHEFAPTTGGAATYTRETAWAASRAGFNVTVWAPAHADAADADFPFCVNRLPLSGNQNWPDRLILRRALRNASIDWTNTILYLPEPGPMRLWIYADILRLPRPSKLVITLHGSEILRFAAWPHRRRRFLRFLRSTDRIGVVSSAVRDLLLRHFPIDPGKVVLVPGALSQDFVPLPRAKIHNDGNPRLLTVGRIHPRKGQLAVLEALATLPADIKSKIIYRLVGPVRRAAYADRIKTFARAHGIVLEGPDELPDSALPQAYSTADIFVMASEPAGPSIEGFGLVFLEAAACGLPVIGHDTGGVHDAIGPENGFVIPLGDRPALARAIEKLLRSEGLRRQLGAAGPAWARRFSWSANLAALFPE